jgi:hypothetical protein
MGEGGNTLPSTIVYSETPNEDNARIYEYLRNFCYPIYNGTIHYPYFEFSNTIGTYFVLGGASGVEYRLYNDGKYVFQKNSGSAD